MLYSRFPIRSEGANDSFHASLNLLISNGNRPNFLDDSEIEMSTVRISILTVPAYQPYREINAGGSRSAGLSPVSVRTIPIGAGAGL
jgi:hypothetical protein